MSRESADLQEIFRIAAESRRLGAEQGKDTIARLRAVAELVVHAADIQRRADPGAGLIYLPAYLEAAARAALGQTGT